VSDFDDVLERLIGEPQFRAALARDPAGTLSGYDLSADELELLSAQVSGDAGGLGGVEDRTSKASLAGLLSPLVSLIGDVSGGPQGHLVGFRGAHQGLSEVHPADQGLSDAGSPDQGLSEVDPADQGLTEVQPADQGLTVVGGGAEQLVHGGAVGDHAPVGYHPHIDADGDGHWDSYTAVQHADGSVDISVDRNHDGVVDFVGHDRNHDGLVESADYDEDFNGTFETHMGDTNGDGWLDTRRVDPSS